MINLVMLASWAAAVAEPAAPLSRLEADRVSQEIDALILKRDFTGVEQKILWLTTGEKAPRNRVNDLVAFHILDSLFKPSVERYLSKLEEWAAAAPDNGVANLMLSKALHRYAWEARGTRFANDVPPAAQELYAQRRRRAEEELEKSFKLLPKNPLVTELRLSMRQEDRSTKEELRQLFEEAKANCPDSLVIHTTYLSAISPKWGGGSEDELFSYARNIANQAGPKSALVGLTIFAQDLVAHSHGGKEVYLKDPLVWQERKGAYDALVARFPTSGWAHAAYANDAFVVGDNAQGIKMLRMALQVEPDHPEVIRVSEKYARLMGKGPQLGGLSEVSRGDVSDLLVKANAAYKRRDLKEAERLYREAVESHPTRGNSWHMLGAILIQQGRFQEALPMLERSVQLSPRRAAYYTQLCHARMKIGDLEKGIEDCTKAISIDSAEKAAYLNRGHAYKMLGRGDQAEADFAMAKSLP